MVQPRSAYLRRHVCLAGRPEILAAQSVHPARMLMLHDEATGLPTAPARAQGTPARPVIAVKTAADAAGEAAQVGEGRAGPSGVVKDSVAVRGDVQRVC